MYAYSFAVENCLVVSTVDAPFIIHIYTVVCGTLKVLKTVYMVNTFKFLTHIWCVTLWFQMEHFENR